MVYFDQNLPFKSKHCLDTGMQNRDEASQSISPAGRGQLMIMLITLEPHYIYRPILLTYTF